LHWETGLVSATLRSPAGFEVTVLDIGAALQSIVVPTSRGPLNCILGYGNPNDYLQDTYYVGVTVGRFANRINRGQIVVDGVTRQLDINEMVTGACLHGGHEGFYRQRFRLNDDGEKIVCHLASPAGAQGFPANLKVDVIYRLLGDFALSIEFVATADAATVVNLANHAYFNLDWQKGRIDSHLLMIAADSYTAADENAIPTGEIRSVQDSGFDLREQTPLNAKSLDQNFVIRGKIGQLRQAASLYSPESGVGLTVHTTQAGLQVYTGEYLDAPFAPRQGVALEAQNFPDAPNQPGFPSARLLPGETYRQQTVYEFVPPKEIQK
jgi:aldose 1-epimerase